MAAPRKYSDEQREAMYEGLSSHEGVRVAGSPGADVGDPAVRLQEVGLLLAGRHRGAHVAVRTHAVRAFLGRRVGYRRRRGVPWPAVPDHDRRAVEGEALDPGHLVEQV